jgi:hypothetical protein
MKPITATTSPPTSVRASPNLATTGRTRRPCAAAKNRPTTASETPTSATPQAKR